VEGFHEEKGLTKNCLLSSKPGRRAREIAKEKPFSELKLSNYKATTKQNIKSVSSPK
jgi:hypothetical protein